MHISEFNYQLPEHLIAQHPPKIRGESRLLVLNSDTDAIEHKKYKDLIEYVFPGDTIILNDTKVIKARLNGVSSNGKNREFLLLERHNTHLDTHHWKVLYKGKVRSGEAYHIGDSTVTVEKVHDGGIAEISSKQDLLIISDKYGTVPLPPYMKRDASQEDIDRYQTEFAREAGSVAAPTASLNFTNELKNSLEQKGVHVACLTLHVGIGTFLPIRTNDIKDHIMHSEFYVIPKSTVKLLQQTHEQGKKIIAVGTTVTRTLEHVHFDIFNQPAKQLSGEANIFIYPGYEFKAIDMLLTNFHAPKTTVLMLAAAFASWSNLKNAYKEAVDQNYRFLSYGDSMLISKN